ncbi:MAG: hypothetical protein ABIO91_02725 [Pyrinomonadaceae bacterium]
MIYSTKTPWLIVAAFLFSTSLFAQKPSPRPKPRAAPKSVVFAVLDGGKRVEPIASIDGGKLAALDLGEGVPAKLFAGAYYKPKSEYALIFGGAADGNVSIVKSNIGTECGGSSADTIFKTMKAKLSGHVMALAMNAKLNASATGFRRKPSIEERGRIEKLVAAEFTKQGASALAVKTLRYHNLTAVDVEDDDLPEFVGSYWIAPTAAERRLLFFIAEQDANGKIHFSMSEHSVVKPDGVMSGDVKDLDTGVGHELLLDVLDYDADGVREIFTIGRAFEGNNYYVYKRGDGGKWAKVFETYSYRCAY